MDWFSDVKILAKKQILAVEKVIARIKEKEVI